jgi:DNA-binding response OmpR family regulator
MNQSKILCIDDDNDTCELVAFAFKQENYEVVSCSSAEEGMLKARKGNFGAIILDNRFEGTSGAEICKEIRSFDSNTPIIFFSGEARTKEIGSALESGANAYLVKATDFERLTDTVIQFIEAQREIPPTAILLDPVL